MARGRRCFDTSNDRSSTQTCHDVVVTLLNVGEIEHEWFFRRFSLIAETDRGCIELSEKVRRFIALPKSKVNTGKERVISGTENTLCVGRLLLKRREAVGFLMSRLQEADKAMVE